MAEKLQNQLKEVGSKLQKPPSNKDALIRLLKQAATCLSEVDQSPPKAVLESMQPFVTAVVKPELLKHQDKEVKLLVATCTCEITRVTAPEAPYDDDVLKDVFRLIVSTFRGLRDTKNSSFGRRVLILDTVAKYRSCVVMLDLDCDDLVKEMFRTFFAVVSDEHSENVISSMKTVMAVLLEESEDVNEDLLLVILSVLGRNKKDVTTAARRLAMGVVAHCVGKLEPGIKQFIVSSMSKDKNPLISHIDYHEVIYDVYRCAPYALSGIVPYLTGELLTDNLELRLKAVKLVGDLFALPGPTVLEPFRPIFFEFLKRRNDIVVEVRMSVLENVKFCLLSNPSRADAPQLIAAVCDRLLDYEESIRKLAVGVVADVACHESSSVSPEIVKLVAERLRDKSLLVKKYAMERLSDIYRTWCSKHVAGLTLTADYDWIPGRILRSFYDKDFRSDSVERILCTSLFPAEFSVRDKVRNWVRLFSKFDKLGVKALEKILEQKQRLRLELQKYLSLRHAYKEGDGPELQKKAAVCFRFMSRFFVDPVKTEADFQLLDQLKDGKVWRILTMLLDPNTSSRQTRSSREELLKIIGEKHRLYAFLSVLSMKCSYTLFNKDYVKEILLEADLQKSARNGLLTQSCMNLLLILACFSPLLLNGIEKDLVRFLEDDNEVIKEGVLHVVAKAGGTIRKQLGKSSSTLDLILERICLEGSRRHAKYAVHALAALTRDDGLKSLFVLYKKLVEMLEKKTHLPSVLQSLGCIAQMAMPVFETQEGRIEGFIKKDILTCSAKTTGDEAKESWDYKSEICSLKICGLKTLVKSYLPVKDAHLRVGIDKLIETLRDILSFGEISKDIESSSVDKAHLKLASAKAVLRLSKQWDKKIPIDVFYLTLRTSEDGFPEVRKIFLNKVHRYVKERSLDPKYACAFLLGVGSPQIEERRDLSDAIQMRQQGKTAQNDGSVSVVHPEYVLPYLVHALAHHPSFPDIDERKDVKAYEPIYRKLYFFLSLLVIGDGDGKPGGGLRKEEIISVVSILRSIKNSEDAVDVKKSKNLYAICDLGLSAAKRLAQKQEDVQERSVPVSLPETLYKPRKTTTEKKEDDGKKEEADIEVVENQTWLADATSVAHFDSLSFEADGNVPSEATEGDMPKDDETDGNEAPLGKTYKRLKTKAKKDTNNGGLDNVVDLSGIHSGDMDVPAKSESINGHGKPEIDEKRKRKRTVNGSAAKRRRSTSGKSQKRPSSASAFEVIKADGPHGVAEDEAEAHVDVGGSDFEKPKVATDANSNRRSGSVKKRKRRRVSGLTKCTSKEGESHTTDLIGSRIKVWWPMDKAFYEGVVKSYDHQKKRHVVLYNDGDVEVLRLENERWQLVDKGQKSTKRNNLSKSPRPKRKSTKKGSSKNNKESTGVSRPSMGRSKRTPRKNRQKGVSGTAYFEAEQREDPDVSGSGPGPEHASESEFELEQVTFSKVENLDTEEEPSDREESNEEGKSISMEKSSDSDVAQFPDDEPLSVWKSRVTRF